MSGEIRWNELSAMPDGREFEAHHNRSEYWQTAPFHAHEFYEFYFFISGENEIVLENYSYKMHPGDMVVFPPGYMHRSCVNNSGNCYERMYIYIGRDCLRSMGSKDFNIINIVESKVRHSHFKFSLSPEIFASSIAQADEIIAASPDPSPAGQLMNRCRLNMLMINICGAMLEAKDEVTEMPSSRLNELILFIQDNISEKLNLDALADRFFVSKYHLLHEFKAYTNTSIYQYILSKRVIYAKILLQSGVAPGDVYAKCGFTDYSGFYKAFRKDTGLSPQEYIARMADTGED